LTVLGDRLLLNDRQDTVLDSRGDQAVGGRSHLPFEQVDCTLGDCL
jgi:hypothetical protein